MFNRERKLYFFFSGRGVSLEGMGNYYLLEDAQDQTSFLRTLPESETRKLDTEEKIRQRYFEYLSKIGFPEKELERGLLARDVAAIFIIADGAHFNFGGAKGLDPIKGFRVPNVSAPNVYRLYSAGPGQMSTIIPAQSGNRTISIFASTLVEEMLVPGLEISVAFAKTKINTRERARALGFDQAPDYSEDINGNVYYFWP